MTVDPILFLKIAIGAIILIALFLRLWQYLLSLGIKDSNYPVVQHAMRRRRVEKKKSSPFLPGSKIGGAIDKESSQYVEDIMKHGLSTDHIRKAKKKRHPFVRDLMDIRRAIILDDLLDRKWNDRTFFSDGEDQTGWDEKKEK